MATHPQRPHSRLVTASGRLQKFITPAFKQLGVQIGDEEIGQIAALVADSMAGAGRFFHTPDHVLQVGQGSDPLGMLAALFHDLVYFQVDHGFSAQVGRFIAPLLKQSGADVFLRAEPGVWEAKSPPSVALGVFGFSPGDCVRADSGRNEFLSALAAAQALGPFLDLASIAAVCVCIEATIPFRPADDTGRSPAECLYDRLRRVSNEQGLGLDEAKCREMVRRAVRLANQDVTGFAGESVARFLKDTWDLVPESNPLLRNPAGYTVRSYRQALQGMERFFALLDPAHVFQTFDGEPPEKTFHALVANAAVRRQEAHLYFQLKLVSAALLECLGQTEAEAGQWVSRLTTLSGSPEESLVPWLPPYGASEGTPLMQSRLMALFEAKSDPLDEAIGHRSALTAYLLGTVGLGGLLALWPFVRAYFEGRLDAGALLARFPKGCVGIVRKAVIERGTSESCGT